MATRETMYSSRARKEIVRVGCFIARSKNVWTRRTTLFVLLCNQAWGQGGRKKKKVVAPSGTKGAKKVGCRNVVVNAPRFLPVVQCTGTLQEPPGTWESRHMPLPFLIRRLLFVVAEKLPVHLTSSASRWHRHA